MKSKKIDNFINQSLIKMFQMVGFDSFDKTFVKQKDWYSLKTWTEAEEEEFKKYFVSEAKKKLGWSKSTAEKEYAYFNLMWGWKVSEEEGIITK